MSHKDSNFSNRERKTIILLSVVMLFIIGVLLITDRQGQSTPDDRHQQPSHSQSSHSDTLYRQQIAERRRMQEEHYRRQAEHYRLQEEYYEQKDKFYRQEIERMRKHNLQQSSHSSDKMQPGSQTLPAVHSPKFTTLTIVDPNTADSATLCSIPGIARGIAGSIIRQRQRLGGFYDVAQLLECQYFSEDLLPWFAIADKPALKKISINKATFYHLVRHPYISKAQTQDILRYIRIYGPIQDSTQLSSTGIFTSEELSRLLPYLEF